MKEIGISIYPDFDCIETIKETIDIAKQSGYSIVFTSMQLADLGFENTTLEIDARYEFLFNYCYERGMQIHADINDRMLQYLGASPANLKPIYDLHIPVLRVDGGFSDEEIAQMTKNPFEIIIEENASMLSNPKKRVHTIIQYGDITHYYACHNFFPLNETGLSFEKALELTKIFKDQGIRVGIFIGSLYSSKDLNSVGRGVVTIERHRYLPSHIQAMELFVQDEYDYVIFGDSHPSKKEIVRVSEVWKNNSLEKIQSKYNTKSIEGDIQNLYCIELPVWLNKDIDESLKKELLSMVFLARADQPQKLIRCEQSRYMGYIEVNNTIKRNKFSITMNNCLSNRYMGELQIALEDLAPVEYVNVIGQVKPYAKHLLEKIKGGKALFVLKEE